MRPLLLFIAMLGCTPAYADRMEKIESSFGAYTIYKDTKTGCEYLLVNQNNFVVALKNTCEKDQDFE